MSAPMSPDALKQYEQQYLSNHCSNNIQPFVGSMELVRPGWFMYTARCAEEIALLLKNEPIGSYLMCASSVNTVRQAVVIKSETGIKYIHDVNPIRFLVDLKKHRDMTNDLANLATASLWALDSYDIDKPDYSTLQKKFPEVSTILFLSTSDTKIERLIQSLIILKQYPALRAFITFTLDLGPGSLVKICEYLEGHQDDPNWGSLITALMRSLQKNEKSTLLADRNTYPRGAPLLDARFSQFFDSTVMSDFQVKVGDRTLHLHRIVLATASEYFSSFFSGRFSAVNELKIDNFSFEVVCASLEMLYKGEADFSKCSLLERLLFAHYLQDPSLIHSATALLMQPAGQSYSLHNLVEEGVWPGLSHKDKRIYFATVLSSRWKEDLIACESHPEQIKNLQQLTLAEIKKVIDYLPS